MSDKLADLLKSNKGGIKLFYQGYSYEKNKLFKNRFYWNCEFRKHEIYKCKASAVSTENEVNNQVHNVEHLKYEHNHESDPLRKEMADFKEKLKQDAKTGLKVCQILQNNLASCSKSVLHNLPSKPALKQIIYRAKSKVPLKIEPKDIFFEIDENEATINNEKFIIKDKTYDTNKRIILLSNKNLMKLLEAADYWVLDGTFKIVPTIFQQLYTIHGNIAITGNKTKTFPLLYCLCTNKNRKTYDFMFELLNEYGTENDMTFSPKICILDFEKASIQSLKNIYENVILHGCHFHLGQILYRQIQTRGLAQRYATDLTFRDEVKCILALSFLAANEILYYFHKLLGELQGNSKDIANWFDENYVSGTCSAPAKYKPEFWSCEIVNRMKIPRTQNSAEAWHHHINQVIDKKKPGFYLLLRELIKETIIIESDIEKMILGEPQAKRRKKYIQKEEKLQKIIDIKEDLSEIKYLKEISKVM